jgi:hypothetical protein
LLQAPEQEKMTAVQEEKCLEKERGRKEVLPSMMPSSGANTDWIKVARQKKSKQSAVTTMMKQVHENQYQIEVAKNKGKATQQVKRKQDELATSKDFTRHFKNFQNCIGDRHPPVWLPTW